MSNFHTFKMAIEHRFKVLSSYDLFRTKVSGDALWSAYLAAFPEGTNPIYRTRTKHECSCCRDFIRNIGNAVAIVDGELLSIWGLTDTEGLGDHYTVVADTMNDLVLSEPIVDRFLYWQSDVGVDKTHEDRDTGVHTWEHFHVQLPNRNEANRKLYIPAKDIAETLSETRALHDVFLRGLAEISTQSLRTVDDLITNNALYRGEEHQRTIQQFLAAKDACAALVTEVWDGGGNVFEATHRGKATHDRYAWSKLTTLHPSVLRLRNTAMGTLLLDLTTTEDVETSVRKYESMVAPQNYRRPTALVTPRMVDAARATVKELGLESALERRYATLADVSPNNVLFADRGARPVMKDAFSDLATTTKRKKAPADANRTMPIEQFLYEVLPGADSLELQVENQHAGNFVSLVAPADPTSASLFAWDNRFSWSYTGDVADAIKERVKQAGGNVTGDVCCRLAWSNYDDLDLHMIEACGQRMNYEIHYINKGRRSPNGGMLDVDMNAGGANTREPVENIVYPDLRTMMPGKYTLCVHQYCAQEATNLGFEVQIDVQGVVTTIAYAKRMPTNERITVAYITKAIDGTVSVTPTSPATQGQAVGRKIWGVTTQEFHRVNLVMLSPNHWDEQQGNGNRHYFFMLADCLNDGTARGFYNEHLSADLQKHRKVFEVLGAKMRTEESPAQLSGLGFSSTLRATATVRVKHGTQTRVVNIAF